MTQYNLAMLRVAWQDAITFRIAEQRTGCRYLGAVSGAVAFEGGEFGEQAKIVRQ